MKNIFALVLMFSCAPLMANAASDKHLDGVWVLDAMATEYSMINGPRPTNPKKVAEWLIVLGGYLPLLTYEFEGDKLVSSAHGANKKAEYRLRSREESKLQFVSSANEEGRTDTLTVYVVDDDHIRVLSAMPETGYLLWKRGSVKPGQASADDIKAAMDAWVTSGRRIIDALKVPAKN